MITKCNTTSYVAICARGSWDDPQGKGILFDHTRIQHITKQRTLLLLSKEESLALEVFRIAELAFNEHKFELPFLSKKKTPLPPFSAIFEGYGLVVMPGMARLEKDDVRQVSHEYRVLRTALNRGQPILAFCAGSWKLWEQLIIWTQHPDKLNEEASELKDWHKSNLSLAEVTDHNYNGGMPRLSKKEASKTTHNVALHRIRLEKQSNSFLEECFREEEDLKVNSVHWLAVNEKVLPPNICITAKALKIHDLALHNRKGNPMQATEESVEAFESKFGAPIVGVQWHPEAYDRDESAHAKIIKNMALAGEAYARKRCLLKELRSFDIDSFFFTHIPKTQVK